MKAGEGTTHIRTIREAARRSSREEGGEPESQHLEVGEEGAQGWGTSPRTWPRGQVRPTHATQMGDVGDLGPVAPTTMSPSSSEPLFLWGNGKAES